MFKKSKLSCAVASVIAAGTFSGVAVAAAEIEEVIVTATKRSVSMQDIPVAVQALSEDALDKLNIGNFSDYIMELPSVVLGGRGPGQNNIFIRGMATDSGSVQIAGVAGVQPNVALYLDEAPVTAAARNLDVYVTDMERIEVLAGPQGTLFGSSSQAGTVRLITNKPDLSEFSGGLDLGSSWTRKGDMSTNAEGYVNIPIIEDKLAVRLVAYSVNNGGYIDNVQSEISLPTSNPSFNTNAPYFINNAIQVDNNTLLAEEDFNESYYKGGRISIKYAINDDWSVLVQAMKQDLGADGVFDFSPDVGDLQVRRFHPDKIRDDFTQTSWTLEGRVSALDVLYTGSYLNRDVKQSWDQTGYASFGPFIPYYICNYPAYDACGSTILGFKGEEHFDRFTHEVRVSTPIDNPLHFVGGVYYDDSEFVNTGDWWYPGTVGGGFFQQVPIATATSANPNPRPIGTGFVNDITRRDEQLAVFGELTYTLNEYFSATIGARYYEIDLEQVGSSNFLSRFNPQSGRNLDELLDPASENDWIPKATVKWTPNDDLLFYFTYSEGFRPGGFNRKPDPAVGIPMAFESDSVKNYEIGWKTTLFNGALQFNGAIYRIDWSNMQVSALDPTISNLNFTRNVGEAEVTGMEGDLIYVPTENLTISGAFSFHDTELTKRPAGATNIVGDGEDLAMTPDFQGNIRARYTFPVGKYDGYAQVSGYYKGAAWSSVVVDERLRMDDYFLADAAIGFSINDNWGAELYIKNIADKRPELFISWMDDAPRTLTNRPRTIGLRISYDY